MEVYEVYRCGCDCTNQYKINNSNKYIVNKQTNKIDR